MGQAVHYEQDDDDTSTVEAYNIFSVNFMQRTAVRQGVGLFADNRQDHDSWIGPGITVRP